MIALCRRKSCLEGRVGLVCTYDYYTDSRGDSQRRIVGALLDFSPGPGYVERAYEGTRTQRHDAGIGNRSNTMKWAQDLSGHT